MSISIVLQAIDVYMAVCLTFVFLGLIEFAYVNVLSRTETKKPSPPPTANGVRPPTANGAQRGFVPTPDKLEDIDSTSSDRSQVLIIHIFTLFNIFMVS